MNLFGSNDYSLKFLALFNDIDKKFDDMLGQEKFLPYNEKIKIIATGAYAVASYVQYNMQLLKHLGEIRNELTHGFKVEGEPLITPTSYAIKQLKKCRQAILFPLSCKDFLAKKKPTLEQKQYEKDLFEKITANEKQYVFLYEDVALYHVISLFLQEPRKFTAICIKNIKSDKVVGLFTIHDFPTIVKLCL